MKIVISDQGREFVNSINKNLFNRFETEHRISTAYHPQTNGLVERFNQTLQRSLVKMANKEQNDWDEYIDGVLFAYRTATQKSTNSTPFEVMYCRCEDISLLIRLTCLLVLFSLRKPILPIELEFLQENSSPDDTTETDVEGYCKRMVNIKKKIFSKANNNIKKAQARYKRDYDRKHRQKKVSINRSVLQCMAEL